MFLKMIANAGIGVMGDILTGESIEYGREVELAGILLLACVRYRNLGGLGTWYAHQHHFCVLVLQVRCIANGEAGPRWTHHWC